MASNFQIHQPYVLATLPKPLIRPEGHGQYVVGDVFGQQPGSKKRKRSEIAVGVSSDAAYLYDVPSSRLITSYPIPPLSNFTCAPHSTRLRSQEGKDAARYTYTATRTAKTPGNKVTLFKDVLGSAGETKSTTVSRTLASSRPISSLWTTSPPRATDGLLSIGSNFDLITILDDGEIIGLHGESLKEKWRTSSSLLRQEIPNGSDVGLRIDHVHFSTASDLVDGIFSGNQDAFSLFPRRIQKGDFDPDIALVVSSLPGMATTSNSQRHLHILAFPPELPELKNSQRVIRISLAPFPKQQEASDFPSTFSFDIQNGAIQELSGNTIYSFGLNGVVPRYLSKLTIPEMGSFVRISKSSILASTPSTFGVFNPGFRSLQCSTSAGDQDTDGESKPAQLVSYFARLQMAVALQGSSLLAIQVEAPRSRSKKRKQEGLLIDSIGRGLSHGETTAKRLKVEMPISALAAYIPGTVSEEYWSSWDEDSKQADALFAGQDFVQFEHILAHHFGIEVTETDDVEVGMGQPPPTADRQAQNKSVKWNWPQPPATYARVDRRWVLYAIRKYFTLNKRQDDSDSKTPSFALGCAWSDNNVVDYLVDAGHLSSSNLLSAFKEELGGSEDSAENIGETLPGLLSEMDPTMELVFNYLAATKLSAGELIAAIKVTMSSLELLQDPTKLTRKQLEAAEADSAEAQVLGMELDRLEQELRVTEHYLNNDSSTRARCLSVALGKLGTCPPVSAVQAIRRLFQPEEVLSLIVVLRMELVNHGWTTRYLDTSRLDQDEDLEAPPDGSIRLLADLLCRCIDSVGPAGWLSNDAILAASGDHLDSADFLASLKLEVSAALEGIEEAVYLRGILSESMRYGNAVQKLLTGEKGVQAVALNLSATGTAKGPLKAKPGKAIQSLIQGEGQMLPLGMKARQQLVSPEKIVSGGEVVQRSRREMGHLASQRVGPYSLERIII